jgi:hypothetical protein
MGTIREQCIHVAVTDAHAVDDTLNAAVEKLMPAALRDGRKGILVRRVGPGQFTLTLDAEVPAGIIWEKNIWQEAGCHENGPAR